MRHSINSKSLSAYFAYGLDNVLLHIECNICKKLKESYKKNRTSRGGASIQIVLLHLHPSRLQK